MKTLILASASPRRREILKQVGIDFTVIPSTKEEVITKQEPKDAVMELALQKAEDVAGRADGDCMVIGADTVVAMEGSILGKPVDKDDAARMLRMLSGSRHQVYTGVACICGEKKHVFYEETSVFFYPVSEDEIRCYIEGRAARFIRGIEGDYYNVVGFPVARFLQVLKKWDEQSSRI